MIEKKKKQTLNTLSFGYCKFISADTSKKETIFIFFLFFVWWLFDEAGLIYRSICWNKLVIAK